MRRGLFPGCETSFIFMCLRDDILTPPFFPNDTKAHKYAYLKTLSRSKIHTHTEVEEATESIF